MATEARVLMTDEVDKAIRDTDAFTSLLIRFTEMRKKENERIDLLLSMGENMRRALRLDDDTGNFSYNDLLDMRTEILTVLAKHTTMITATLK